MEAINRWTLTCQNRAVTCCTGAFSSLGLGPGPDGGTSFTVFDMGDGTFVLQIPGGGGAPSVYPTATFSFLTDYQVITDTNGWITQVTDAARFKAVPTWDGYFAVYSPTFDRYLATKGDELQVWTTNWLAAAKFTATGLDHPSILDILQIGGDASGMSFAGVDLSNRNLSDSKLYQCDFSGATSVSGCTLNGATLWQAKFAGLRMDGVQLSGADCGNADFTGCDFSGGCVMTGANLQGASFAGRMGGLQLSGAACTDTDFTGCDFSGFTPGTPPPALIRAKLTRAVLPGGISWSGANMPGAVLAGANLTGCDLSGPTTNLAGADFTGAGTTVGPATIARAKLGKANLAGADLRGVDLADADFTGADLSTVRFSSPLKQSTDPNNPTVFAGCTLPYSLVGLNWSCLDLTSATLTGRPADLSGLNARGLRWSRGDFTGCTLDRSNFADATLDQAVFTKASLRGAPSFNGARLIGAVFAQAVLEGAVFAGATLGGVAHTGAANFSFAYLSGCNFTQANLYGVIFTMATLVDDNSLTGTTNLQQTDFGGAYLPNTDFTGANLQGARFDGAFMIECVLSNADLTPAQQGAVPASLAIAWLQAASLDGTKLMGANLAGAFITDERGQISYQYYGEDGKLTPEAPMRYPAGSFPDPSSFDTNTLCPNNQTYGANRARGASMDDMMASSLGPADTWTPRVGDDQRPTLLKMLVGGTPATSGTPATKGSRGRGQQQRQHGRSGPKKRR